MRGLYGKREYGISQLLNGLIKDIIGESVMLEIYRCGDCGKYFTEEQMEEKQICYEEEYGVAGMFPYNTYDNVCCCPHCNSTNFQECNDEEEIVDVLNDYCPKHSQEYLINNIIKLIKERYGVK